MLFLEVKNLELYGAELMFPGLSEKYEKINRRMSNDQVRK
jgi:hypothetical protein